MDAIVIFLLLNASVVCGVAHFLQGQSPTASEAERKLDIDASTGMGCAADGLGWVADVNTSSLVTINMSFKTGKSLMDCLTKVVSDYEQGIKQQKILEAFANSTKALQDKLDHVSSNFTKGLTQLSSNFTNGLTQLSSNFTKDLTKGYDTINSTLGSIKAQLDQISAKGVFVPPSNNTTVAESSPKQPEIEQESTWRQGHPAALGKLYQRPKDEMPVPPFKYHCSLELTTFYIEKQCAEQCGSGCEATRILKPVRVLGSRRNKTCWECRCGHKIIYTQGTVLKNDAGNYACAGVL